MGIIKKVRMVFSLDLKTLILFLEAFIYLGLARVVILVPFSKVAPSLGVQMEETSNIQHDLEKDELIKVRHAIKIISRYTFWESKCLVRAIAAMKMLERRHIESTLYLGTTRDDTGKMIAHAWLRSGSCYITGAEGMESFVVVGKFAKYIKN